MQNKSQKTSRRHLFSSSALQALSVVVILVVAGALMLPRLFAQTSGANIGVTRLNATPSNAAGYTIDLSWNGGTTDHYRAQAINGSTVERDFTTVNERGGFSGLKCNVRYTFKVYPENGRNERNGPAASTEASTACPVANFSSFTASGNSMTARWGNANFANNYTFYYRAGNGGYVAEGPNGNTSKTFNGSCGTTYTAYVVAKANGQSGPATGTRSVTTAACPLPPSSGGGGSTAPRPVTTPKPSNTPSRSSGGTSSAPAAGGQAASTAPDTPQNFSAIISSNKIVELSWDAATNAQRYTISRSTDQQNWSQIADTEATIYQDESAEFSTTYFYQLQAISSDGQISGLAEVQATTEAFTASKQTITSDDKKVSIYIPDGAIDGEYSCTLGLDSSNGGKVPAGQSAILGPYDLLCVTNDGDVVGEYNKQLDVTIQIDDSADGYKDLSVQLLGQKNWSKLANFKYDQNKGEISFKLAKSQSFGIFGVKQSSPLGIILLIIFVLLLLVGAGVLFWLWRRRRADSSYDSYVPVATTLTTDPATGAVISQPVPSAEEEFRQAVAQPDCSHLDLAQQVIPSSNGCYECEQQGTTWKSLRICLICGHVGCSDDSDNQHSLRHFQETGHTLIYEFGNPAGNTIGWCYIDQTYI